MPQTYNGPVHAVRRAGAEDLVAGEQRGARTTLDERAPDWRAILAKLGIEVAKKADSYRLLEGSDLHSLAANIDANNLIHPLVLWRAKDGDPWQLADGRNRCAAMATLVEGDLRIEGAICLAERHEGGRIEDLIRSFNIERRHLTPDERRARIAEVIVADPTRSDRSIAVETGYHKNTIGSVRKELETVGTVAHHNQRVGRDGVAQPASKPPPSKEQQLRICANSAKRGRRTASRSRRRLCRNGSRQTNCSSYCGTSTVNSRD
jgi:hypothetical protein